MSLRLGTRNSALARWQAEFVASQLRAHNVDVAIVPITTQGDRRQESIRSIGGEGVFTKEIERALLENHIDLAVHSLKDLPTTLQPGLCLAAVPERESPWDVLVARQNSSLENLSQGAVIGTSSIRRKAQLLSARPDLCFLDIRGNVDTRLRKLEQGEVEALVLAEAGLRRLGLADRISQKLPATLFLPAIGQGALGIETRSDDERTRRYLVSLEHLPTLLSVVAERSMLAALQGGCLAPVAGLGTMEQGRLSLTGKVISSDGSRILETTQTAFADFGQGARENDLSVAASLGLHAAEELLARGAAELISAARRT